MKLKSLLISFAFILLFAPGAFAEISYLGCADMPLDYADPVPLRLNLSTGDEISGGDIYVMVRDHFYETIPSYKFRTAVTRGSYTAAEDGGYQILPIQYNDVHDGGGFAIGCPVNDGLSLLPEGAELVTTGWHQASVYGSDDGGYRSYTLLYYWAYLGNLIGPEEDCIDGICLSDYGWRWQEPIGDCDDNTTICTLNEEHIDSLQISSDVASGNLYLADASHLELSRLSSGALDDSLVVSDASGPEYTLLAALNQGADGETCNSDYDRPDPEFEFPLFKYVPITYAEYRAGLEESGTIVGDAAGSYRLRNITMGAGCGISGGTLKDNTLTYKSGSYHMGMEIKEHSLPANDNYRYIVVVTKADGEMVYQHSNGTRTDWDECELPPQEPGRWKLMHTATHTGEGERYSGKSKLTQTVKIYYMDDLDNDNSLSGLDCNDRHDQIKPGKQEECDGIDNNCNCETDEDIITLDLREKDWEDMTFMVSGGYWFEADASSKRPDDTTHNLYIDGSPVDSALKSCPKFPVNGRYSQCSDGFKILPVTTEYRVFYEVPESCSAGMTNCRKYDPSVLGRHDATFELSCGAASLTNSTSFALDLDEQCQLQVTFGSSASMASGNLFHSERLFDVTGTIGPMPGMTLYYNSRLGYDGPMGMSWTHSYNAKLIDGAGDTYVLQEGDGGLKVLNNQGDYYAPLNSAYPALTILADGTRQLYYKSGVYYYFNEDGKIFAMSDLNGNVVNYAYDEFGNLASGTDAGTGKSVTFTYRWDGKMTKATDPAGNEYEFVYFNNTLEETNYPAGPGYAYSYTGDAYLSAKTDPAGSTTTYAFQPDWKVSTSTDSEGGTRSITYDTDAGSAVVTEKDGGEWIYEYDKERGLLTSKTDPLGGSTSYEYDDYARRTAVIASDGARTEYTYDGWGNVSTVTDSEGQTTSYTYNALSQVTSVTSPEGLATTYSYDATGNMTSVTDATGNTTNYAYDDYGRVASIIAPTGATTSYTYDALGNLASVTDAAGATTSFTYDASGRLASVTAPDGGTTTYAYDASGNVASVTAPNGSITSYTYDANGNVTSMTDAEGRTTTYTYDGEGRLIKVTDPSGATTTYTYGSSGCGSCGGGGGDRLTSITDASGNTTYYYYDPLGRLIQEVDALGRTILYEYDATGRMVSRTDASGNKVLFSYDAAGRMVKKTYPDGTYLAYTYDASGRMTGTANQNEAYAFEYDALGRLVKVTDSAGRKLTYTYDSFGRKSSTDAAGVVSTFYSYDPAGRLASISSPESGTFEFAYDASGRRSSLTYPNGVVATYGYDASGRLVDYLASGPRGDVAKSAYTLDGTGNRTSQETLFDTTTYSYDAAMRIIESIATLPGRGVEGKDNRSPSKGKGQNSGQTQAVSNQAERYSYDIVGNRLTGPDARDSYEYAQGNMLIKDSVASYEYDTNGNLTKMQGIDWWVAYGYDYENRLTRVTDSNGMDVAYKYDPMGRRIEKNVLSQVTRYFYDAEDIAFEYSGNGTVGNIYIHGPGIDEPLGLTQTKGKYYYHADGLGSIIGITDASARLVQSYEYDSFGNLKDRKNRIKQPYAYTGREYDRETGLYYYRARYYMPEIGRFISADPIPAANLYAYVENGPIGAIDPWGLASYPLDQRNNQPARYPKVPSVKGGGSPFEIPNQFGDINNDLKELQSLFDMSAEISYLETTILCDKTVVWNAYFGGNPVRFIGIYNPTEYHYMGEISYVIPITLVGKKGCHCFEK